MPQNYINKTAIPGMNGRFKEVGNVTLVAGTANIKTTLSCIEGASLVATGTTGSGTSSIYINKEAGTVVGIQVTYGAGLNISSSDLGSTLTYLFELTGW